MLEEIARSTGFFYENLIYTMRFILDFLMGSLLIMSIYYFLTYYFPRSSEEKKQYENTLLRRSCFLITCIFLFILSQVFDIVLNWNVFAYAFFLEGCMLIYSYYFGNFFENYFKFLK
jgi:hypothetical protein